MSAWVYIIFGGLLIVIGGIMAGYGWHIMPKEKEKISDTQKSETMEPTVKNITISKDQRGGITAKQITINNYFQQDRARKEIKRKELKQKYPLGYAVFAGNDTTIHVPKDFNYGNEFIMNWENTKVANLTESSIIIDMPDILYKPLNSSIMGLTMEIPRKVKYERRLPFKFKNQNIIPIIEVLEDHNSFVVLVLGFK